MKKIIAFFLVLLLVLPLSATAFVSAEYPDYEYYIKDYHVDAVAHTDRSFEVTETIHVYYNVEKRGIIRDILAYSSTEEYTITNVSVVGDPYEVEDAGDRLSIRIGDADTFITGDKTYTIKYTLEHYADNQPDYDYFYFDIIGDGWDVPIDHFSAVITLPEEAVINEYNITAGRYGSAGGQEYTESAADGNVITVGGLRRLDPYEGITINVEMLEGAFPDAVVYVMPVVIHNIEVTAAIDEFGVVKVREHYDATINSFESFSRSLYTWSGSYYDVTECKIVSENWVAPNGEKDTSYLSSFLSDHVGQRVSFSYEYEMKYRITELPGDYNFYLPFVELDKGSFEVQNRSVTVDAPFAISSWDFTDNYDYLPEDKVQTTVSDDRTTLSDETAYTSEGFVVRFEDTAFKRPPTIADYIAPIAAAALAIVIGLFAFFIGKEKPLTPPIEFYPPNGMNPAELGYIIDHNVSGRDVTSLIYYWASKGYLTIEITDKSNNFVLHKMKELATGHPQYEKDMFAALWSRGANNMVSSKNLEEKFYDTVNNTAYKVKRSFTGMRQIESKGRKAVSTGLYWIVAIAVILAGVAFNMLWGFSNGGAMFGGIVLAIAGLIVRSLSNSYRENMYKSKAAGNTAKMVGILILAAVAVIAFVSVVGGRALSIVSSIVMSVGMMLTMISLPFFKRRTEFGTYVLELAIGFKTFLETAERQRLEMLLEENPDYYYDILPYAQVLGVSDIWEKKFDGLLRQPPQWYYGTGVDATTLMTYHMMRTMTMMTRNMTSRPAPSPSSGGGGFSSGGSFGGGGGGFSGGGSFSGGGFSGGGSGGGGGRSW